MVALRRIVFGPKNSGILSMIVQSHKFTWLFAALAAVGGCATVNPHHDYERVSRRVTHATGQERIYQPEDDELVAGIVDELTQDGITAAEAVEICLLNNPTLQSLFMDVGMARADAVQAGLFSNPFLGISARFPDGGGLVNIEAGVARNIAELWQIPIRKRAAERSLDVAILTLARLAADVAADAKAAYYVAVGTDERLRIAQENLAIAKNLLDLALARQQAGAANELDVNLSRGIALDAEIEVERARLAAANARRELATILGLTGDADALVLTDKLPTEFPETPKSESLVRLAEVWRLDIQTAKQAVDAAQARLEEQQRRVFPVVEIGVASERAERRTGSGQNTILGPSLGVELPIFDQNQARIAKARYALQQARKTLDALSRAVTQEVRGAVDRAMTAWRLTRMYRNRSIPLAQDNLDLSREAYRAGRASFLSVLEAQRFFLETRRGYVEASQSAATMIPALERAVGLPFDRFLDEVKNPTEPEMDADKDSGS